MVSTQHHLIPQSGNYILHVRRVSSFGYGIDRTTHHKYIKVMRFRSVLSKADNILKYMRTRKKRKLYRQWVKRAGLPPEAVPEEEFTQDIIPKIDKEKLRLRVLYMLLGASLVILFGGLIALILYSC